MGALKQRESRGCYMGEDLGRLRRENKVLREEREILKKAAAWFARETGSIPSKDPGS